MAFDTVMLDSSGLRKLKSDGTEVLQMATGRCCCGCVHECCENCCQSFAAMVVVGGDCRAISTITYSPGVTTDVGNPDGGEWNGPGGFEIGLNCNIGETWILQIVITCDAGGSSDFVWTAPGNPTNACPPLTGWTLIANPTGITDPTVTLACNDMP